MVMVVLQQQKHQRPSFLYKAINAEFSKRSSITEASSITPNPVFAAIMPCNASRSSHQCHRRPRPRPLLGVKQVSHIRKGTISDHVKIWCDLVCKNSNEERSPRPVVRCLNPLEEKGSSKGGCVSISWTEDFVEEGAALQTRVQWWLISSHLQSSPPLEAWTRISPHLSTWT